MYISNLWEDGFGYQLTITRLTSSEPISFPEPACLLVSTKTRSSGIINSSLWKRVIAWGRSRAANAYGIIWGTQVKTNMEEFSAECHSVDCSGDSVVLTELEIAIRSKLLF